MTLDALIFDVDGTLAETEEAHRAAFNDTFADFGFDWQWDRPLYKELLKVTGGRARIRHYWTGIDPEAAAAADAEDRIRRLHVQKTALFQERLAAGGVPLRPGVGRLLREAHAAGLRLAIATTTSAGNVEALLASTLGAESVAWFEVIGAGDVVPDKKPAPDIYLWVLERLKLPAVRCLALEDSWNGLQSARRAGVPTVITVSGYTDDQDFTGALAVMSELGEPDRPGTRLDGPGRERSCVDVAALRAWHAASAGT